MVKKTELEYLRVFLKKYLKINRSFRGNCQRDGIATFMASPLILWPPFSSDQGRCLLLLLRISSAHLEILGFPMGGAYQYRNIFCAELSKSSWYPKRKLGVTMHFSEKIKLQFRKNPIHCFIFGAF